MLHIAPFFQKCYNKRISKYIRTERVYTMMDKRTWWQRLFLGLGILTASTAALSGGEASAPARYDTAMVQLIGELHDYAHRHQSHFQLIANGASSLYLPIDGNTNENAAKMLQSVDAQLAESVFYGYDMQDGQETPAEENEFFLQTLDTAHNGGLPVFVLDYVKDEQQAALAYEKSFAKGYIPMATPYRDLDGIPPYAIPHENSNDISSLADVQNYLVLLNPGKFSSSEDYLRSLQNSNYDLLIIDLYMENRLLTKQEVNALKRKQNGGQRLVFAYMSVGEAETYRKYWQAEWSEKLPSWLDKPNENWQDNYRVKFWRSEWKHLLYGSPAAYLDEIINAGFDGAFLDVIDVYQYFQNH